VLHEALSGRRLTKLEYEHALPVLQDKLLDAQFELRKSRSRAVAVIVTGIPAAGRSEVVNELLGWLDPKFVTVYGFREPNEVERERRLASRADWQRAYGEINEFERELAEHRTIVAKFWMSVSQAEQLARFRERDRNPLKRFKVDPEDWHNRKQWRSYQQAAREMIALTDTKHAPWVIVPSDDKRRARLAVLRALCERIESVIG